MYICLSIIFQGEVLTPEPPPCVRLCAQCNKEKQAILFEVISNRNVQAGKMNVQLSRYCTVQNATYKNEIIHAKSFMQNFNIGA